MLDKNALTQLSQLKADINASREFATGIVISTNGKFGFVRLNDGRDAYLSPEKMLRVLPGDCVTAELKVNKQGKIEADLQKLVESPLRMFVANYRVKGNAHFAEPCDNEINRWVFLPSKYRKGAMDGETVLARIIQHPWEDGKAQAKILDRIGKPDIASYEYRYVLAKYGFSKPPPSGLEKETARIAQQFEQVDFKDRVDRTELDFFTIDSASTQDMDDALALERKDDTCILHVAIADPASFIDKKTLIAREAERKTQSLYLCGETIPMLPKDLANRCFSLLEDVAKPILLCTIHLDKHGGVSDFDFQYAQIKSRKKTTYAQVNSIIDPDTPDAVELEETLKDSLHALHHLAQQRQVYRQHHNLPGDNQANYIPNVNDHGKIVSLVKQLKTPAHQLVEECMLLANLCAGEFLQRHNRGLFNVHRGFRADRIGEVKALLKEEQISLVEPADSLQNYIALIQQLQNSEAQSSLLPGLRKMSEMSKVQNEPGPHFALGFAHYATITSPIRRFVDLYNHWAIKSIIENKKCDFFENNRLDKFRNNLQLARQADRELRVWLTCQYVENILGFEGSASIRIVTQQGFGARLDETGIDGFVLFDKKIKKSFDAKRLLLTVGDTRYFVGKVVKVKITGVDMNKKRISFDVVPETEP